MRRHESGGAENVALIPCIASTFETCPAEGQTSAIEAVLIWSGAERRVRDMSDRQTELSQGRASLEDIHTHQRLYSLESFRDHTSCIKRPYPCLCNELDDTTSLLDLLLSEPGDESGLDDEWSVNSALAQLDEVSAISQTRHHSKSLFSTYKLELAEVGEVENGDGAFWGIDLSLGKGDELCDVSR